MQKVLNNWPNLISALANPIHTVKGADLYGIIRELYCYQTEENRVMTFYLTNKSVALVIQRPSIFKEVGMQTLIGPDDIIYWSPQLFRAWYATFFKLKRKDGTYQYGVQRYISQSGLGNYAVYGQTLGNWSDLLSDSYPVYGNAATWVIDAIISKLDVNSQQVAAMSLVRNTFGLCEAELMDQPRHIRLATYLAKICGQKNCWYLFNGDDPIIKELATVKFTVGTTSTEQLGATSRAYYLTYISAVLGKQVYLPITYSDSVGASNSALALMLRWMFTEPNVDLANSYTPNYSGTKGWHVSDYFLQIPEIPQRPEWLILKNYIRTHTKPTTSISNTITTFRGEISDCYVRTTVATHANAVVSQLMHLVFMQSLSRYFSEVPIASSMGYGSATEPYREDWWICKRSADAMFENTVSAGKGLAYCLNNYNRAALTAPPNYQHWTELLIQINAWFLYLQRPVVGFGGNACVKMDPTVWIADKSAYRANQFIKVDSAESKPQDCVRPVTYQGLALKENMNVNQVGKHNLVFDDPINVLPIQFEGEPISAAPISNERRAAYFLWKQHVLLSVQYFALTLACLRQSVLGDTNRGKVAYIAVDTGHIGPAVGLQIYGYHSFYSGMIVAGDTFTNKVNSFINGSMNSVKMPWTFIVSIDEPGKTVTITDIRLYDGVAYNWSLRNNNLGMSLFDLLSNMGLIDSYVDYAKELCISMPIITSKF